MARRMLTDDTTFFAALRSREFSRLDATGCAYLDYTGSGLYAESLVRADTDRLLCSVSGNPHADARMAEHIEGTRAEVLRWLDADPDDYTVVFTANATAAIRLVGESYQFETLFLATDNHNSVNGLRRFARRRRAPVHYLPIGEAPAGSAGLFAYPAQSNFSGAQYPLEWARHREVLLDAAAFVPTHALSLRTYTPAFVVVSFYKVFGYPTGVGALIVRHDAMKRLKRPWFAGGTVERVWVSERRHKLKSGAEGFEDGTPNFLALAALAAGLEFSRTVGVERLSRHVTGLGNLLRRKLAEDPRIRIYGPAETTGGVVAFNVEGIAFDRVERAARDANIAVRSGCFCNPGAAESVGVMGAVRASLGIASNEHDVMRLVSVLGELQ
jgi:selenocysteine lyase/cysteine desulfurase